MMVEVKDNPSKMYTVHTIMYRLLSDLFNDEMIIIYFGKKTLLSPAISGVISPNPIVVDVIKQK